jgi:hypothetical protein
MVSSRTRMKAALLREPAYSACSLASLPPFLAGADADGPLEHGAVVESSGDEDWDAGKFASEQFAASQAGVGQDMQSIYWSLLYAVEVQAPKEPESLQELECWTMAMRAAAGQAVAVVAGTAPAAGMGTLVTATPPRAMPDEAGRCVPARSACSLAALPPFPGGVDADRPLEHGGVEGDSSDGADEHLERHLAGVEAEPVQKGGRSLAADAVPFSAAQNGNYLRVPAGSEESSGVAESARCDVKSAGSDVQNLKQEHGIGGMRGVGRLLVLERHVAAATPEHDAKSDGADDAESEACVVDTAPTATGAVKAGTPAGTKGKNHKCHPKVLRKLEDANEDGPRLRVELTMLAFGYWGDSSNFPADFKAAVQICDTARAMDILSWESRRRL